VTSRRQFLTRAGAASAALVASSWLPSPNRAVAAPAWTSAARLDSLRAQLGSRLIAVEPPLQACNLNPSGPDCAQRLADLQNPFFNEDQPGATQTTGWLDAWEAAVSPSAVAAESAQDVSAAVNFARANGVRLAIKGTGHDYLGRSNAPDSLLIWTHNMRDITVHDAFIVAGGSGEGVPAISVGAGTRWLEAYTAATPLGRYVQGGGCTSVGAAGGFIQGSGFGSFSKRFGSGAAGVLEYEVVTADGKILLANDAQNQDLFWALRGGGGGTFGVVTRATLLSHDIPNLTGLVRGSIKAHSDNDFRKLIGAFIGFYPANLNNQHWGEQVTVGSDNSLQVTMTFLDLTEADARSSWQPLLDWVDAQPDSYAVDMNFLSIPFASLWDAAWWDNVDPSFITRDGRPGAPSSRYWWSTNQGEVSQFVYSYLSRWLPVHLFSPPSADRFADALFGASRQHGVTLHFNKGLSGAEEDAVERTRRTPVNPVVFDAAALLIVGAHQESAYPGVPGHEPDLAQGRISAAKANAAIRIIRDLTPGGGAYVNEADFFEPDWQTSFWGPHYPRLLEIKRKYDPENMFRVHHGVGSET
jgi:FAD binding domain/Berberine and berberine like